MKKIYLLLIMSFLLVGCSKKTNQVEEVDISTVDKSINNLIVNLTEEININDISEDEKVNEDYLVEEIEHEVLKESQNIDTNLTLEEKLPQIKGFTFNNIVYADMEEDAELPQTITYLDTEWIPMYVYSKVKVNSGIASLYLTTIYPYNDNTPKISYNDKFITLLKDTIRLFGKYVYSENEYISNIEQLTKDNRLSYVFDLDNCYLITLFQDNVDESRVDISYYFIAKEIPHSISNEDFIISYIMDNIKDFRLNVYYETKEGKFVMEYGKENKLSTDKGTLNKNLRLR